MKKFSFSIFLLLIGFAAGGIFVCYLSSSASTVLLEIIAINYQMEQHILGIQAKKQGDIDQAVIHYANLVEATSAPGLYCFSKERNYWSLDFPIAALVLKKMTLTESKVDIAIKHAMLGDALEKSGRINDAQEEYIQAANIMGFGNDVQRIKKLLGKIESSEIALLSLADQYIYTTR